MSSEYRFYKVSKPDVGERVELDELPDGCRWAAVKDAPEWAADVAARVKGHRRTIDIFDAGEKIFGKRPVSVTMNSFDMSEKFNFGDGTSECVPPEALDDHYRDEVLDVYVYDAEEVGGFESFPGSDGMRRRLEGLDMQLVDANGLERLVADYMAENEDDLDDEFSGAYELRPVYVIVKAMFAARLGQNVLFEVC